MEPLRAITPPGSTPRFLRFAGLPLTAVLSVAFACPRGSPTEPVPAPAVPSEVPVGAADVAATSDVVAAVPEVVVPTPEAGAATPPGPVPDPGSDDDVGVAEDPVPEAAPVEEAPQPPPSTADLDPTNDDVTGPPDPIPDCEALLEAAGVQWEAARLPITRQENGDVCGVDFALKYVAGPTGIRWSPRPTVSCGMALAFARLEAIVQEEAERLLDARVTRIDQGGTTNCRRIGRFPGMMSEHSYANAIDLRSFRLDDGRTISVERHFGDLDEEPGTPEGRFLRRVAHRLYDEDVFSCVLTEFWDDAHEDHFHVDLARYRVDGTR